MTAHAPFLSLWRQRVRIFFWGGLLFCLAPQVKGDVSTVSQQYARAHEIEIGAGDLAEAIGLYRQILADAGATNSVLAGKALLHIGLCERRRGRNDAATTAWKQLMSMFPAEHPLAMRAREETKALGRDMDRVTIRGRVVTEQGQPVQGAYVLAGDWGNAPPIITGENGEFSVERRFAGRLASGARYCLFFAEHLLLPLVAAGVIVEHDGQWDKEEDDPMVRNVISTIDFAERDPKPFELVLHPSFSLAGYVVDPNGRPIWTAAVRVTGFVPHEQGFALPFDTVFPDSETDSNGQFRADGLAMGLRYVLVAEKEGYRLGRVTDVEVGAKQVSRPVASTETQNETSAPSLIPSSGVVPIHEIVLQQERRVSVDARGVLRAEVDLRDSAERAALDSALKNFDRERQGGQPSLQTELAKDTDRVSLPARFPFDAYPFALRWLRGDPEGGAPLRREDLRGRVIVYHCSSAYLDASLRGQFPRESGVLAQLADAYAHRGLLLVWVLPASEDGDDATRLALETQTDVPVAVDRTGRMWESLGVVGYGGNVVVDSEGKMRKPCSDQQLFRVLKSVLVAEAESGDLNSKQGTPLRQLP